MDPTGEWTKLLPNGYLEADLNEEENDTSQDAHDVSALGAGSGTMRGEQVSRAQVNNHVDLNVSSAHAVK